MKPHRFKGSGPGFGCLYVAGSEEGARQCGLMVDNAIHVPIEAKEFVPAQEQHWPGSSGAVWQAHSALVADLLVRKQGYGDAWRAQGYMGNIGRVLSKASRLKNMMWRDETGSGDVPEGDESILDTLTDMSALCAFAIANLEDGNRWGR